MPLYRYECQKCKRVLTMDYSMANKPETIKCISTCGGTAQAIMSAPSLHISKGSSTGRASRSRPSSPSSPVQEGSLLSGSSDNRLDQMDNAHKDETSDDKSIEDSPKQVKATIDSYIHKTMEAGSPKQASQNGKNTHGNVIYFVGIDGRLKDFKNDGNKYYKYLDRVYSSRIPKFISPRVD